MGKQQNQQADRGRGQQGGRERGVQQGAVRGSPAGGAQERSGGEQSQQEHSGRQQGQQEHSGRQQGQQDVHGEGNYAASRQYNQATKDFVESGRVESAARDAAPRSAEDAQQMASAEAEGKRRAKGEDPALNRRGSQSKTPESRTPRPGKEEE